MLIQKLKIRLYPDECLKKKSLPVKSPGVSERMLIAAMTETMHESKGVGLAAPQVGINEQIIVVDIGEGPRAFINPRIVKKSGGTEVMEEGCLSIPGVAVHVKRAKNILVQYINEENKPMRRSFTGLWARVVQHEVDHLNGKLIIDYVGWGKKGKVRKQLRELEKVQGGK